MPLAAQPKAQRTMIIQRQSTPPARPATTAANAAGIDPRKKFDLLMCTATDGIHIIEWDGRLIDASEAFCRMVGYSAAELARLTVADWDTRWDPLALKRRLCISCDATIVTETVYRRKDGSLLDVELVIRVTHVDGNDYVSVASRDISERKHLEQELRIAAIAFDAHEGMFITDAARRILRPNRAFCEASGYSADEMIGRSLHFLRGPEHDDAFFEALWAAVAENGFWRGELQVLRKSGKTCHVLMTMTAVRGADNAITHYVATQTDISARKAAEQEIRDLAFFDPLTKLGNRRLLFDRLQQALAGAARSRHHGALLFIDLDHFKALNDSAGHDVGDLMLQEVARRLQACVREGDTVIRQGGDEFVAILPALDAGAGQAAWLAEHIGERVLAALNAPYQLAGQEYFSTPSIGIALFGGENGGVAELMRRADLAMYQAKAGGRNALRFFDPAMQAAIRERGALEKAMRAGLGAGQFLLHYQRQVGRDGELIGAEALVRWQHPTRGLVAPADFIPLAEESGLIIPLGMQVLDQACRQLAVWQREWGMRTTPFSLSVNVSARQFRQADFVDEVLATIERTGVDARMLTLELTESMLVDDVETTIGKMAVLRARGVAFSLDDFGIGFSSLSYLKRLPLNQLKIDRSFVNDVLHDPNDNAIARMVVALGNSLGLEVVAEGVESDAQRAFLCSIGCDAFQGYLFGRPAAAPHFDDLLARLRAGTPPAPLTQAGPSP
jgi:diguanylate cyclase (GGDEF)-like protein/PAS domain S-box-containing protein